eukprot:5115-Amphidinium_carterae.1
MHPCLSHPRVTWCFQDLHHRNYNRVRSEAVLSATALKPSGANGERREYSALETSKSRLPPKAKVGSLCQPRQARIWGENAGGHCHQDGDKDFC